MNTKRIEKLSTKEMSQIKGGENKGEWILTSEGWIWIGPRDSGSIPPPPSNP